MRREFRLPLAVAAFQPATGHSNQRPHRTQHPAGAGISIRPFARSQRRFRHHCEVNVPGLHLRFHVGNPRKPVRSQTPSLRSVSRPNRGDLNARNPFSAPISNIPDLSPVSTPPRVLFRKPSGSKRSTGPISGSSSYRAFDCFLLPAASSFDSTSDRRSKLASPRLTYRSVNPGTESMIVKTASFVKQKNAVSKDFQQVFRSLYISKLRSDPGGFFVHKSALRKYV
jgi:hypothetical protein